MAHELNVWLFRDWVGTLDLQQGRLSFQYRSEWLQHPHAMALSQSLPLQQEAFDDARARPFFAGLLPEGQMRRLIARDLQVSAQNDFALLDRLGGDCAGAITFLRPRQTLAPVDDAVQWLTPKSLATLLEELPRRPMLAGKTGMRLSLAGAQDKLPVVVKAGPASNRTQIGVPLRGTASTHILKPAISSLHDSVMNEGFCLALAHALQFKAARAQVQHLGEQTFLLVERYDRYVDAQGQRQRLHQEDFCQALGVVPELKYQNEGGPDLAQCFDLVRRLTRPSALHILRLLDSVVFNALIGNHDAHAKNFSLLYADAAGKPNATPELAPLYDTLCTAVYANLSPKMAMKLSSKYKFSEVQAQHWERFAQAVGLAPAQTRKRVQTLAEQIPIVARQLQRSDFSDLEIVEDIIQIIEARARLTLKRLAR